MKKRTPEEIIELGKSLYESMSNCRLCPMECKVNRLERQVGKCNSAAEL